MGMTIYQQSTVWNAFQKPIIQLQYSRQAQNQEQAILKRFNKKNGAGVLAHPLMMPFHMASNPITLMMSFHMTSYPVPLPIHLQMLEPLSSMGDPDGVPGLGLAQTWLMQPYEVNQQLEDVCLHVRLCVSLVLFHLLLLFLPPSLMLCLSNNPLTRKENPFRLSKVYIKGKLKFLWVFKKIF